MKKFYLAGVLGVLLCAFQLATVADEKSDVKKALTKVPLVTCDNFVSLQLFRRADSKSEGYWLRFDNSGLRIKFRQTPTKTCRCQTQTGLHKTTFLYSH